MSAAVLDRQPQRALWAQDGSRERARRSDGHVGHTPLFEIESNRVRTLNELITDTWEALAARGTARCPACDGRMNTRADTPGEAGGECMDCGARLC
jgi:hypothetical protein